MLLGRKKDLQTICDRFEAWDPQGAQVAVRSFLLSRPPVVLAPAGMQQCWLSLQEPASEASNRSLNTSSDADAEQPKPLAVKKEHLAAVGAALESACARVSAAIKGLQPDAAPRARAAWMLCMLQHRVLEKVKQAVEQAAESEWPGPGTLGVRVGW